MQNEINIQDKGKYISELVLRENLNSVNASSREVHPKQSLYLKYVKRILDVTVAFPVCIILLPVNFVLGILTFFDVGNPIFFRQKRIGKDGKTFYLTKFRNMTEEKDRYGNLRPPGERVTRLGMFVRKYSLDELLNFWSILKGDMSLIGPRPLPVEFRERFSDRHKMREVVRPGLECPCISEKNKVRYYQEQFENDIWYVEHVSFFLDCRLCFHLVKMVFNSRERGDHAKSGGGDFLGYNAEGKAFSMRHIPEEYEKAYRQYTELTGERKNVGSFEE